MCAQQIDITDNEQAVPINEPTVGELELLAQFREFRATHDIALRDKLVSKFLHLVYSVARRFSGVGESLEDLIQEGSIGLLNAVDLYDPERGVKFSTYACHLITSQIQHYLRDRGRLIRQPAWVQELNTKISRTAEQLLQEFGRDPLPEEIAERLNITEESVQNVLSARELNHIVSLSAPTDTSGDNDMTLLDNEKANVNKLAASLQLPIEDRIVLEEAITSLKPLEQQVVRLYFFADLNQTEIARKLNISVNYSSYLLRRAINKIKAVLEEQRQREVAALIEHETAPAPLGEVVIYDTITGAYTGAYLRIRVAEEIARARRYPTNFTLMLAQVQGLTNDEELMKPMQAAVSQFIRTSIRTVDLLAHMGSGQFALLLPHTGREAKVLGERLCKQLAARAIVPPACLQPLALNIGFAVFPIEGTTAEVLFRRAENALALAAKNGVNTVVSAANTPMLFPRH